MLTMMNEMMLMLNGVNKFLLVGSPFPEMSHLNIDRVLIYERSWGKLRRLLSPSYAKEMNSIHLNESNGFAWVL